MFDRRRVAFVQTDDVDQSLLSSIRFELVIDKRTVRTTQYQITLFVVLHNIYIYIYDSVDAFCRAQIVILNEVGCHLSDSALSRI